MNEDELMYKRIIKLRYQNNVEKANKIVLKKCEYTKQLDKFYYSRFDDKIIRDVVKLLNSAHESDDLTKLRSKLISFVQKRDNKLEQNTLLVFNVIFSNERQVQDYISFKTRQARYYSEFNRNFDFSKKSSDFCKFLINLMMETGVADYRIIYLCNLREELLYNLYKQLKTVDPFEYLCQNESLIFKIGNQILKGNWSVFKNLDFVVIKDEKVVDYLHYYAEKIRKGDIKLKEALDIRKCNDMLNYCNKRGYNYESAIRDLKYLKSKMNYLWTWDEERHNMKNAILLLKKNKKYEDVKPVITDSNIHNIVELYLPNRKYEKIYDLFWNNKSLFDAKYNHEKLVDIIKREIDYDELLKNYTRIDKEIQPLQFEADKLRAKGDKILDKLETDLTMSEARRERLINQRNDLFIEIAKIEQQIEHLNDELNEDFDRYNLFVIIKESDANIFLYTGNVIQSGIWRQFVNLDYVIINGERVYDYLEYYANNVDIKSEFYIDFTSLYKYGITRNKSSIIRSLETIRQKIQEKGIEQDFDRYNNVIKKLERHLWRE